MDTKEGEFLAIYSVNFRIVKRSEGKKATFTVSYNQVLSKLNSNIS
ncbi:MAG: hypothetical protein HRT87_00735 [Legionellales bacterium]|nr:hypothetical protein [Legionellales bacterium]